VLAGAVTAAQRLNPDGVLGPRAGFPGALQDQMIV
jgi:hypothetical protein